MKKLLAVIAIALVVAAAAWIIVRVQLSNRQASVPELLPGGTLLLVQAPDLERSRERWHGSDLYRIWREPAVQALLEKPLHRFPQNGRGRKTLDEFLQLKPTDGFVALTTLDANEPKLVGGFHFAAEEEKARQFIAQREAEWLPKAAAARRETIVYEQHKIETVTVSHLVFATVYDNHWFLAANDVAALKAVLDRADRRQEKVGPPLQENEAFLAATKHLPGEYAGMIFVDPRPFVEKLIPLIALTGQTLAKNQMERLRKVQSVASAIGFDHGKLRETDFVAMPRLGAEKKLTRTLLGAAGTNTVFYSVSRLHWSDQALSPIAPTVTGLPAILQQLGTALTERGIAPEDLRLAFGEELEIAADWPAEAHWPTLFLTLTVNDNGRARKVAEALTSVKIAGAPWTRTDRNGAVVYSAQPFGGFVPLNPAIALTDKMMFAGSDAGAVEAAITRVAQPGSELEKSAIFREAVGKVPAADSAFNYVDTRLLFERADAALRPLLLMGATFYPALSKSVDVAKLPPPEAISKHLSPIVMSQRYTDGGYVTESIGPMTFRAATLGLAGGIGGLFLSIKDGDALIQSLSASPLTATPSPTPTPSPF